MTINEKKIAKKLMVLSLSLFSLVFATNGCDDENPGDVIELKGTPYEVGTAWGKINGKKIKEYVDEFVAECRDKGVLKSKIYEFAKKYEEIQKEISPWWREESDAIAQAVGIPADLYSAYLATKFTSITKESPKNLMPGNTPKECTSYLAVGNVTKNGNSLLHKSRQYEQKWQVAYKKTITVKGQSIYSFVATGDVSDTGVLMFVNEKGLAGVMDQGEPYENPCRIGLPTPAILRYIAEKAADCKQAMKILDDIIEEHKDWYSNGLNGSIWLFVDRKGEGLIVENISQKIVNKKFITNGFASRGSGDGSFDKEVPLVDKILKDNKGKIDAQLLNGISRNEKISGEGYVSGFTAEISGESPAVLTRIWMALGRPSVTLYLPLFTGIRGSSRAMANGQIWRSIHLLNGSKQLSESEYDGMELEVMDKELAHDLSLLPARVSHRDSEREALIDKLTEISRNASERYVRMLKLLELKAKNKK